MADHDTKNEAVREPGKRRRVSAEDIEQMTPQQTKEMLRDYAAELNAHDEVEEIEGMGGGADDEKDLNSSGVAATLDLILKELRDISQEEFLHIQYEPLKKIVFEMRVVLGS